MRIFGFLSIFLTKINTNSAKICLLFRRKGFDEGNQATGGRDGNFRAHGGGP